MVALSRSVGRKHAMEMLLTGDMTSADDARRIGLVNRVVEPGVARDEALKLARKIAAEIGGGRQARQGGVLSPARTGRRRCLNYASEIMLKNMMTHDAEEGISAFVEKRTPVWEDR